MPIDWKSEEMKQLLMKAVSESESFTKAAETLSNTLNQPVKKNQVIGAYNRYFGARGNKNYEQYKAKHEWTEERLALLRKCYALGYNDWKILDSLNEETGSDFTIRAIVNKRNQIGLTRSQKVVLRRPNAKVIPFRKPAPAFPDVSKQSVHSYAVCKWIDGDPKGLYSVCAQPAAVDAKGNPRSWCPHHCAIVYVRPGQRQPEPSRFA